jgi:HPt (histidine-containing phosphotransfer) domain-containing protein
MDRGGETKGVGPITVLVEPEVLELVPQFLENRKKDLEALEKALATGDLDAAARIGKAWRGTAGSYGFHFLAGEGQVIEERAAAGDKEAVAERLAVLDDYLRRLDVRALGTGTACRSCGTHFSAEPDDPRGLCPQCAVRQAEAVMTKEQKAAHRPPPGRRRRYSVVLVVVLFVVAAVVIAFQAPKFVEASRPAKPIRVGFADTDEAADRCIANLWRISKTLQEGKTIEASLSCPASGQSYRAEGEGDDRTYHCPNPGRHGLSILFVEKGTRIPQAVK